MVNQTQADRMTSGKGLLAALDHSGGSTPKALRLYGIEDDAYSSAAEMFEETMDRDFDGKPSATYLWDDKGVVPVLKIDKGLADAAHGVS